MRKQVVKFLTRNGAMGTLTFQVAAVNMPLVSVSKLFDDEWNVIFDTERSVVQRKKAGRMIDIKRERLVDAFVDAAADPYFSTPN